MFPDDWIKPGEFSYCHSCGYHLLLGTPLCAGCRGLKTDNRIEQLNIDFRRNLATIRKDAGLPALFWMK